MLLWVNEYLKIKTSIKSKITQYKLVIRPLCMRVKRGQQPKGYEDKITIFAFKEEY